jgi:hypothetical protein
MNLYGRLINRQTGEQIKFFHNLDDIKQYFWIGTKYNRKHIAYLFDFYPTIYSPYYFSPKNCEEILTNA